MNKYLFLIAMTLFSVSSRADEIEILTGNIPPYSFQENGLARGLIVELLGEMAKHAGHSGKVKFLPWKRALQDVELASDKPRLIIPLNRSPEREDKFTWLQEIYVDKTVLVTHAMFNDPVKDVASVRHLKAGVLLGSPLEAQLKKEGFTAVEPAVDEETNARKLQVGRIAIWHVARLVAPFIFERHHFQTKNLLYGPSLDENDLYLGGSKNITPEVMQAWRAAFKKIKEDGTYDKIVRRYLDN